METIERDDRDCLSDSHRDYLLRYIQYELERQEQTSDRFLREWRQPVSATNQE